MSKYIDSEHYENWEDVTYGDTDNDIFTIVERLKVPGGWLYHRKDRDGNNKSRELILSTTMCFVPENNIT